MSLYLGDNLISGVAYPVEPTRNLGQIIQSTIPLTDAGLHLLDGSLILGGGIYDDFVSYIASIASSYPSIFVTEQEWQEHVRNNGETYYFVYDSVNNTVRLPLYGSKLFTTNFDTAARVKGDGMSLGLTNGTNLVGITGGTNAMVQNFTGVYGTPIGTGYSGGYISNVTSMGITTDPTKSGIVADFHLINRHALSGYYYIVVATSTKTNIEVDIDDVVTDLNGKADTDLVNANPTHAFGTKLNDAGIITIIQSYVNGLSGFNRYSNGLLEQWGYVATNGAAGLSVVNFLRAYKDTNYNIMTCPQRGDINYAPVAIPLIVKTDSMQIGSTVYTGGYYWRTIGYYS